MRPSDHPPWWKFEVWLGRRDNDSTYVPPSRQIAHERKDLQGINWISVAISPIAVNLLNTLAELVDAYTSKLTQNEALIDIAPQLLDPVFVDPRQIKSINDRSGGCQYGDNCKGEVQHEVFAALGQNEENKEDPMFYELASCAAHSNTMIKNMAAWLLLHDMYRFCDLQECAGKDVARGITMTSLSRAGGTETADLNSPTEKYATLVDKFGQNYLDYVCHTDDKAYNYSVALRQGNEELMEWINQCRAGYISVVTSPNAVFLL